MNKLYDVIEPTVIDDELIRTKCIQVSNDFSIVGGILKDGSGRRESHNLEFEEIEQLRFSFMSISNMILKKIFSKNIYIFFFLSNFRYFQN